jgi:hypothetical protein
MRDVGAVDACNADGPRMCMVYGHAAGAVGRVDGIRDVSVDYGTEDTDALYTRERNSEKLCYSGDGRRIKKAVKQCEPGHVDWILKLVP